MYDVLISHVAADTAAAEVLTTAVRAAGFTVAIRPAEEEDPDDAVGHSRVVVLLGSPAAVGSEPMHAQILRAHERGLPLIPVLVGISHVELVAREPTWRTALGAATSIEAPAGDVAAIAARVVAGVRAVTAPPSRRSVRAWLDSRSRGQVVALAAGCVAVVVAIGLGSVWAVSRTGDRTDGVGTKTTEHVIHRSTETFTPGPVADSATTPLKTTVGDLRINEARLASEYCSLSDCVRTEGSDRFVVISVTEWDGRDVPGTDDFMRDMDRAYVSWRDEKAEFRLANQADARSGRWDIVYDSLPVSALAGDVRLAWPGSSTLVLHLTGE